MHDHKPVPRWHHLLRAAILFGIAFYIAHLVRTDSLVYYIAPRMQIYIKLSALVLFVVSVYQFFLGMRALRVESCNVCEHEVPRTAGRSTLFYGLFMIPLALGFLLPDTILGSTMAEKKGMNLNSASAFQLSAPIANGGLAGSVPESTEAGQENGGVPDDGVIRNGGVGNSDGVPSGTGEASVDASDQDALAELFPHDAFTEFYAKFGMQLYQQDVIQVKEDIYLETLTTLDLYADAFVGKQVQLTGFVYREDNMAEDQFVVGRFAITCCSADAAPYGVLVKYERGAAFAEDEWVTIKGTVSKTEFNGFEIMQLNVSSITKVEAPKDPYVYPNYEFGLE